MARAHASAPAPALLPAVRGFDTRVPLVNGGSVPYLNLDYAASTPALEEVAQAVEELLPWYSSVHRGAGFKSQVSTRLYEAARDAVSDFLHLPASHVAIFTRNTTDSINLLARSLPADARVLSFEGEHHANLLPWRARRHHVALPIPASPETALASIEAALAARHDGPTLVAVTAASNVTGEVWPIADVTRLAHGHGARVLVDAAQVVAHQELDIAGLDADYVAFSGHKMYAPFGAGVLAGRRDWLEQGPPGLLGGGAVRLVDRAQVQWSELPDRQEAGSPNVVGAFALGVAARTLQSIGLHRVAAYEADLTARAAAKLAAVAGATLLRSWDERRPRVPVLSFTLPGLAPGLLATALSAEHAIGVRHGAFCAHPLMQHLAGADEEAGCSPGVPGAVRMSFGLGITAADLDRFFEALGSLAAEGPRWQYRLDPRSGAYVPTPDPRPRPAVERWLDPR